MLKNRLNWSADKVSEKEFMDAYVPEIPKNIRELRESNWLRYGGHILGLTRKVVLHKC